MTIELYKRFRPKSLKRIVGNNETVKALENMLEKGTLPHSILFHGPSGCGKTTLARILSRELGCKKMDFEERNSADFRGIDSIRSIINNMHLQPVGDCRVYLIDECHRQTLDAMNASLKMLEDTPDHVYFFLCTTEPEKLIKTIRNRCTSMPVSPVGENDLRTLAKRIMRREKMSVADEVIDELIDKAEGSPRAFLVGLDSIKNLEPDEQLEAAKQSITEREEVINLCRALIKGSNWSVVSKILKELDVEPESARRAILGYCQACLLNPKPNPKAFEIIDIFRDPLYDLGRPGLIAGCFEIVQGL